MGLIDYFRILKALIILFLFFIFYELNSKSKWESSKRNAGRFQFRYCATNIEWSTLFQNDFHYSGSSSKISPQSSITLSQTIESVTNGSVG